MKNAPWARALLVVTLLFLLPSVGGHCQVHCVEETGRTDDCSGNPLGLCTPLGACFGDPANPIYCDTFGCPAQECRSCTPGVDDDQDGRVDEELINGWDDDLDGCIDEDVDCSNHCASGSTCGWPGGDRDGDWDLYVPWANGEVVLDAKALRWGCITQPVEDETLQIVLSQDASLDCENHFTQISIRNAMAEDVYSGQARLTVSRRWESFDLTLLSPELIPPTPPAPQGLVDVTRFLVRVDLKLQPGATPPQSDSVLDFPCGSAFQGEVFLYGHVDVARWSLAPYESGLMKTAIVLTHAPGRMSHPKGGFMGCPGHCDFDDYLTARPLNGCPSAASHQGEGFHFVAPGGGFEFSQALAPLTSGQFGKVREFLCKRETDIHASTFTDAGPMWESCAGVVCDGVQYRSVRFCADTGNCDFSTIKSDQKCDIMSPIPTPTPPPADPNLIAIVPIGAWDPSLAGPGFPRDMEVSTVEGALVCDPAGTSQPYWYGSYSHVPLPRPGDPWEGPEYAVDLVDNWLSPGGGDVFKLVGGISYGPVPAHEIRTMYFFSSANPEYQDPADPTKRCSVEAKATPAAVELCTPGPYSVVLDGTPSVVQNCCECGGAEYQWTGGPTPPPPGPVVTVEPTASTLYTLEVKCSTSPSCSDTVQVPVTITPLTVDAGADATACLCGTFELSDSSTFTAVDCSGVEYRWRRLAPVDEWVCGDDVTWRPASPTPPYFPCTHVGCGGTFELEIRCQDTPNCSITDTRTITVDLGPKTCTEQDCATLTSTQQLTDDDSDGVLNEELDNGMDDDSDGCTDEDITCARCEDGLSWKLCPGESVLASQIEVVEPQARDLVGGYRVYKWDANIPSLVDDSNYGSLHFDDVTQTGCGEFDLDVRLEADNYQTFLELHAAYDRSWEVPNPGLVPNPASAAPGTCVARYLVRGDMVSYVYHWGPPWTAKPPCLDEANGDTTFFYGYLDIAYRCDDPSVRRYALVLTHPQGALSHPPSTCTESARPHDLEPAKQHPDFGWTIVAPVDEVPSMLNWTLDLSQSSPSAATTGEAARLANGVDCRTELAVKAASTTIAAAQPGPAVVTWLDSAVDHPAGTLSPPACGCQSWESVARCEIPQDSLAAISIGHWTGDLFPGNTTVHSVEGFLREPSSGALAYVYGVATQNTPSPSTLFPTGPERLFDLSDNEAAGVPVVGAPRNWTRILSLHESFLEIDALHPACQ